MQALVIPPVYRMWIVLVRRHEREQAFMEQSQTVQLCFIALWSWSWVMSALRLLVLVVVMTASLRWSIHVAAELNK